MAGELRAVTTSGQTLYAFVFNGIYAYNAILGYAVEFAAGSWADYALPLSEIGPGSGIYFGDVPVPFMEGSLVVIIYQQAGASPVITDPVVTHYDAEIGEWGKITRSSLLGGINDVNSNIASLSIVDARLVGWGEYLFPSGQKISISGNDIVINLNLEDSGNATFIGWAVWFKCTISGYPPTDITWLTTVTAQNQNIITVAAMPPYDLAYQDFNVYLFPPGLVGGGATAEDVAAAILVTPANKLATLATGEAAANVTLWAGAAVADPPLSAQETADALLLAPAGAAADGSAMDYLADIAAANLSGSGALSYPVTVNDESSNPIDGVEVWISTDSAGASVVAGTLHTSALGVATFMLDAGTYYLWRQRSGYNFANPVTIVVS